jgi:hypothetical protein
MQQTVDSQVAEEAAATLSRFMGDAQMLALSEACAGEEAEYFVTMLILLATRIDTMPRTYDQDGKGDDAIAYLHYFVGGCDWYITERDMNEEQLQAFGLCDLGMGFPEIGYVSLPEITAAGAELDLHWTPKPLKVIKKANGH